MAKFVANVDVTTETFGAWVIRTNTLLDALSNEIITANTTVGLTGNTGTPRNGALIGVFAANTFAVTTGLRGGNTSVSANLAVISNSVFTSNVYVTGTAQLNVGDYVVDYGANSDIGVTGAPRLIYSFPKATFRTGKLMVQASRTGNNQIAEMVVAHDNTDSYLTVYGTVASPAGANNSAPLGTFTTAVNNANVEVYMTQTANNTAVKVVAHLIR